MALVENMRRLSILALVPPHSPILAPRKHPTSAAKPFPFSRRSMSKASHARRNLGIMGRPWPRLGDVGCRERLGGRESRVRGGYRSRFHAEGPSPQNDMVGLRRRPQPWPHAWSLIHASQVASPAWSFRLAFPSRSIVAERQAPWSAYEACSYFQ